MALELHTFGPAFGLPDPSPFAMKGQLLLKLSGLEHKVVAGDVTKAPKGKFPMLVDNGEQIPDTTFIRWHLEDKHGIDFDKGLKPRDKAIAWAVEKMLEDHLYWIGMYERWAIDENFERGPKQFFSVVPAPMRWLVTLIVRRQVIRNLWGHGMSRHSPAEMMRLAAASLQSLSDVMGKNKYLMGSKPCGADATAFSFIAQTGCDHFDSELVSLVKQHKNLVDYCDRMMKEFYPELAK